MVDDVWVVLKQAAEGVGLCQCGEGLVAGSTDEAHYVAVDVARSRTRNQRGLAVGVVGGIVATEIHLLACVDSDVARLAGAYLHPVGEVAAELHGTFGIVDEGYLRVVFGRFQRQRLPELLLLVRLHLHGSGVVSAVGKGYAGPLVAIGLRTDGCREGDGGVADAAEGCVDFRCGRGGGDGELAGCAVGGLQSGSRYLQAARLDGGARGGAEVELHDGLLVAERHGIGADLSAVNAGDSGCGRGVVVALGNGLQGAVLPGVVDGLTWEL